MNYEKVREKCIAEVERLAKDHKTVGNIECANVLFFAADNLRDMPLPEVKQEPAGHLYYIRSSFEGRNVTTFDYCLASDKGIIKTVPVYEIPPDAEALRKENEQLRELATNTLPILKWYKYNYPYRIADSDSDLIDEIESLKGTS